MQIVKDLFNIERYLSPRTGNPVSERGGLIGYFSKEMERPHHLTGIRLAHYTLDQLYALKSIYTDIKNRKGNEPAIKYLWKVTRTEKATSL